MRRRTFLAAAPMTPFIPVAGAVARDPDAPLAPFQPNGAESFARPDVHAGDRPAGASFASRSAALGLHGAAATAHPLATQAAIAILRQGGSAADAAIAANACLGFLEPTSAGIGGDCFAMVWDPASARLHGLAGSGPSPRGLDLATVRQLAPHGLPPLGRLSVSVPGAVDGWWTLHRRFGRLPWASLFAPAIDLATNGAPVPQIIGYYIKRNMAAFARHADMVGETANARHVYAPGGTPPDAGDVFRNPDLARTYRHIADGGRDALYRGEIARAIAGYFRRLGGGLTEADLAPDHGRWTTPLATTYRGVTVHALAENTQGIATLQMLNMLEHFDLRGAGFLSPQALQLQIEAKRLAYADRARYYADPDFAAVPAEWLISKPYAATRAALIRPDAILAATPPGDAPSHADTTYFTVADDAGMMVSMIQSNFRGMGSGLVSDAPGNAADWRTLGFMFQDRGQLFSLADGHPNIYAPGKRPFQTIIPGFASSDGAPWLSFGVMGGDMQPQGQVQTLLNRIDYGLDIQAAGDAPRWHHEGSAQSMNEDAPDLPATGLLRLESGIPAATRAALAGLGWTLGASDGGFGRYQAIETRQADRKGLAGSDRIYAAAAEMRADGVALAF